MRQRLPKLCGALHDVAGYTRFPSVHDASFTGSSTSTQTTSVRSHWHRRPLDSGLRPEEPSGVPS